MAGTGEERVLSELKDCRESIAQIRNDLTSSIGQLESKISGLRGSLAHVRDSYRAVQTELDQAHESSGGLETQLQAARGFDAKLSQMESTLASLQCLPVAAPPPVIKSGADFAAIKRALLALTAGAGQESVLQAFVDHAADVVKRAILFVNKENRFEAWRSHGFPADALGSLVVDDPKDPIMDAARTKRMVYREQAPADARPSLGADAELPNAFAAIPLVFDEYVPIILYADSDSAIDVDYLEVLSYLAALVLKNQSLQQTGGEQPFVAPEAPRETETQEPTPFEAEAMEEPEPELELEPEPEPAFQIPVEKPAPAPPVVPAAEDWEIPESMRQERTPGVIEARAIEPPRIEPQAPPPEPTPMPKPAPSAPAAPVADLSPEEAEKYGNEARRFARLLVSEIKLYNEDEVYNGRQNSDLYLRLKRDVDRSREMYEKRVHPAIAKSADYFHEELIRILAREDASLMGPAYPGPVVRR